MRIIAGTAKGIILQTTDGESTRPTLGRVKENFFNAINFDVADARVLDLFAGSGQLGLEALSRGAKEAVFVDSSAECVETVRKNAQKTKLYDRCNIYKYDYAEYLSGLKKRRDFYNSGKFDIVFIDPPYDPDMRLIKDSVKRLVKDRFVSDEGLIICETGNGNQPDFDADIINSFSRSRIYKYGKIYITVLTVGEGET